MSEEMLGLARLCRSFELASLEKGYVKKALDAYDVANVNIMSNTIRKELMNTSSYVNIQKIRIVS